MARKRAPVSKKNRLTGESLALAKDGLRRKPIVGAPELSIIVPTFNESENIPVLVDRLRKALPNVAWEMIVVDDDSPDGTPTWRARSAPATHASAAFAASAAAACPAHVWKACWQARRAMLRS